MIGEIIVGIAIIVALLIMLNMLFPDSPIVSTINDVFLKPLQTLYTNILSGIMYAFRSMVDIMIDIAKQFTDFIFAPLKYIGDAWSNAVDSLSNVLGPFSFASPMILSLMFLVVLVVSIYIVKVVVLK